MLEIKREVDIEAIQEMLNIQKSIEDLYRLRSHGQRADQIQLNENRTELQRDLDVLIEYKQNQLSDLKEIYTS